MEHCLSVASKRLFHELMSWLPVRCITEGVTSFWGSWKAGVLWSASGLNLGSNEVDWECLEGKGLLKSTKVGGILH